MARKNITVYKVLRIYTAGNEDIQTENYLGTSPYQHYTYHKNTIYTASIEFIPTYNGYKLCDLSWNVINEGLHTYNSLKSAQKERMKGLFGIAAVPRGGGINCCTIVKMTIPKGTLYYHGNNNHIVSEVLFSGTP